MMPHSFFYKIKQKNNGNSIVGPKRVLIYALQYCQFVAYIKILKFLYIHWSLFENANAGVMQQFYLGSLKPSCLHSRSCSQQVPCDFVYKEASDWQKCDEDEEVKV